MRLVKVDQHADGQQFVVNIDAGITWSGPRRQLVSLT